MLRGQKLNSIRQTPLKSLDQIQTNLVFELLRDMERAASKFFLTPPPGAMGRGKKIKYHLISVTKSISKIFYQTLCVFSQMKGTTYIRRDFYSVP